MSIFTNHENETLVSLERESGSHLEEKHFRLLLAGDWSGENNKFGELSERAPVEIDRDNFDEILRRFGVEMTLNLSEGEHDSVALRVSELEDFHPDKIYQKLPIFTELRETRRRLFDPRTFQQTARSLRATEDQNLSKMQESVDSASETQETDAGGLLEQILAQSGAVNNQNQKHSESRSGLDDLVNRLVKPYLVEVDENEQSKLIEAVDEATGDLMRGILHHPQFQALEAAWRAAYLLVTRVETGANLKIYLFDATKEELAADLKSVGVLSESAFYKLLNRESFDSRFDESWAIVCGNYEFKIDVDDTAMLMRIAKIAELTRTAFIAQADSEILGIKSPPDVLEATDIKSKENSAEGKFWAMLRALPESAYVGLTFPRFLSRMPYGAKSEPIEEFSFAEICNPGDNREFLWTNSSFACALLLAQTFDSYEWQIAENLILDVNDLPLYTYRHESETRIKPLTETVIRVGAAEKIIERGLMPIITFRDGDTIRLARFQSIAAPPSVLRGKWNL